MTPVRLESNDATQACEPDCGCRPVDRRAFIKLSGLAAAASLGAGSAQSIAGPFEPADTADHFVPADKKLKPEWVEQLFARGDRTWYTGDDRQTIAMPVGGLCAGQVYLAGDGRLAHWDIFNIVNFTGYGADNYQVGRPPVFPLEQGFALEVSSGGNTVQGYLHTEPEIRFSGEYPIGTVEFKNPDHPLVITQETFSPFIPLNEEDSALPAIVVQFTVKNTGQKPAKGRLVGWLENAVAVQSSKAIDGFRSNRVIRRDGLAMVFGSARAVPQPESHRDPIVLADFEAENYGDWAVEGEALGPRPATGTLENQQQVSGFAGEGLVNTFLGGDRPQGKLTSPPLKIERNFVNFLIGGGSHKDQTAINLLVDGKVARTAVGRDNEKLEWRYWDVRDLAGKEARIEIVDRASGPWGHINIDQIELADKPRSGPTGPLHEQSDFGTMAIAAIGPSDATSTNPAMRIDMPDGIFNFPREALETVELPFGQKLIGGLSQPFDLPVGGEATLTFLLTWHFPNRAEQGKQRGNFYATRFRSAADVAEYVARNLDRLAGETRRWHETWYDSTLPHWLLDRLFSTASTLATSTCQWWANGRFWAWEGVGCCHGTCAHVWNYEHLMARLFPRLERSVREMQDYNPEAGFVEDTGMVRFRGEGWGMWAGDGQAGTVLKAYREHLSSANSEFLKRNWPRIKKSLEFLIREDANDDGLLEGEQHNTYDINFFGANTMVGSLYLAALRAAEEMAREMGETAFADRCRKIFEAGSRLSVEKLFNGEYFIQEVDLQKHPKHQYGEGCLADQLFGQGWAHQVGLGYIYPKDKVLSALKSIWVYDWAPDIGPQNEAHPPQRWFARPGEAGLFTCTWPKGKHLGPESVLYRDEVWTGIEYQVAGNMAWDGMLTEALAICRGVHERYHPAKHNPWNEIECGDHYARGMASYGVFLGLCGFEYHGPRQHLGFAPRLTPENFRAAFSAAEGWGSIAQSRDGASQTNRIELRWGKLPLQTLAFELPEGQTLASAAVTIGAQPLPADARQDGRRVTVTLAQPLELKPENTLEVKLMS